MDSNNITKRTWPGSDLGKYFCVTYKVEIRKDFQYVKGLLIDDFLSCPKWHPEVKDTCFQDVSLGDQIGAARKCVFEDENHSPPYLWQQLADRDDNRIIFFAQEENLPAPIKYIGGTMKVREVDDKHTAVEVTISYVPQGLPFTGFLARGSMKEDLGEHLFLITQGIKYHCETGQIASGSKVRFPPMYQFREFTSLYDLHYSNASIPTVKDPFEGKTRFSGIATIEIKKPLSKVREILWNLRTCPFWHSVVGSTEFKDPDKTDGPGAVRKCKFYDELVSEGKVPEYVWEECLDTSGNRIIFQIQDENRPSMLDCVGKIFYIEEIDPDHTMLTVHHYFRPKLMPLTRYMATHMMKKPMQEESYTMAWCIKYHCETGKEARYDMVPKLVEFKEVEDIYDV